jgi:hypothetical protein
VFPTDEELLKMTDKELCNLGVTKVHYT